MHNFHRKHRYVDIEDMELTEKLIQKSPIDLRNISSKIRFVPKKLLS